MEGIFNPVNKIRGLLNELFLSTSFDLVGENGQGYDMVLTLGNVMLPTENTKWNKPSYEVIMTLHKNKQPHKEVRRMTIDGSQPSIENLVEIMVMEMNKIEDAPKEEVKEEKVEEKIEIAGYNKNLTEQFEKALEKNSESALSNVILTDNEIPDSIGVLRYEESPQLTETINEIVKDYKISVGGPEAANKDLTTVTLEELKKHQKESIETHFHKQFNFVSSTPNGKTRVLKGYNEIFSKIANLALSNNRSVPSIISTVETELSQVKMGYESFLDGEAERDVVLEDIADLIVAATSLYITLDSRVTGLSKDLKYSAQKFEDLVEKETK